MRLQIYAWTKTLLYSETQPSYRSLAMVLAAIFATAFGFMIWLGAAPITGPWDVVALLNACWRILSGQIPHVDYHNPIGPLTYLPIVFGMKMVGPCTSAIVYGTMLLVVCLIPWAWSIAASRLQPLTTFLFVSFLGLLLISPRPLGFLINETTYAMIYNREGYVLLSMLLVGLFLLPRETATNHAHLNGISTGLLLGLLLYCKITYFAVAFASTLFCGISQRRSWRWFWAASGSLIGVGLAFYWFFRIDLAAYLLDIKTAGLSQLPRQRLDLFKQALTNNFPWIYVGLVFLILWEQVNPFTNKSRFSTVKIWVAAFWIIAIALFVDSGNAAQRGGVDDPLFFVAGIIVFESFRRTNREPLRIENSSARLVYAASVFVLFPLFCGTILGADTASFIQAIAWNIKTRPAFEFSRQIHAKPFQDFFVPENTRHITSYWPASEFPQRINEGCDLLRKHLSGDLSGGVRVTTLGFTDPFSFAFGLHPALDGNQWWDLNMNFDSHHHPTPKQFLGDASLVMVPLTIPGVHGWGFDSRDVMLEVYGAYLKSNFSEIDSTESWALYKRRSLP